MMSVGAASAATGIGPKGPPTAAVSAAAPTSWVDWACMVLDCRQRRKTIGEGAMADPAIRKKLEAKEFFIAPGAYDMLTALLANRLGFECVYAPGYWMVASTFGLPDVGLATYTEMLERVTRLVDASTAPVIADADTGYGGLINVRHTVRGYERAGVTGVQIEDQEFPKKCGHTPGKRVVSVEESLDRIKVALDTRTDPNLLIVARTDARQPLGFDAMLERAQLFAETGADLLFLEGLEHEAEMVESCRQLTAPIMLNMVEGGSTPIVNAARLAEIGVACAIYPATCALHAMAAIEGALKHLKTSGESPHPDADLYEFRATWDVLGFHDIWDFEKRWARS